MFSGHSVSIEYDELVERRLPVPDRALPFLRRFAQTQVEQLAHRLVVGEGSPHLDDLAQAVVQRLDRVGRIDRFANRWRIVEEGCQRLPVFLPERSDRRILPAPLLLEGLKRRETGLLARRRLDAPQTRSHCLALLPGNLPKALAHLMHDAQLHASIGKDRLYRFG